MNFKSTTAASADHDTCLPLQGMRIIEVSAFVAAPLGGMTLAQLGAEVIRVDPIGGNIDNDRWPIAPNGRSIYWASLNKGKKSVTLDLRHADGQRILSELIGAPGADAGIFLTNMPAKGWNTFEALTKFRPDLILTRLTGNFDGSPAVDYTVNCASGFAVATGSDETPINHVLPAWDIAAGLYLATAVLAADRKRARTGLGQELSVALSDVMVATVGNLGYLADIQINGHTRGAMGNYLYGAYGRDFTTKDGRHAMVVALTGRQWQTLAAATGIQAQFEYLGRAPDAGMLFKAREAITQALIPWFGARDMTEVENTLNKHNVLWGPYQDFETFFAMDRRCSLQNPLMQTMKQPGLGTLVTAGSPIRFPQSEHAPIIPAPTLGEHGPSVLRSVLGYTEADVHHLCSNGILGTPKNT